MENMRIITVAPNDDLFRQVKDLGANHSSTLGFLPEGAFADYAYRKQIIAAADTQGILLGYVIYRVARESAYVVHLCVKQEYRRKGVATALHNALIQATRGLRWIQLRCRRDYEANETWPRLGYTKIDEITGRSKVGKPLVLWRIDHGHRDLLTDLETQRSRSLKVAIDANIFYDLDPENPEPNEESNPLNADWLADAVEFRVTAELSGEINRNEDPIARKRQLNRFRNYQQALAPNNQFPTIIKELQRLLGEPKSLQDESDLRHLAHAIGTGCSAFITRDQSLLDKCDTVSEELEIAVLRPAQLIVQVDEMQQGTAYEPARFSGTTLLVRRIGHEDVKSLVETFQLPTLGESKQEFRDHLAACMAASPGTSSYMVAEENEHQRVAYALYSLRTEQGSHVVPLLRVRGDLHGPTLARHLLFRFITNAGNAKCNKVVIAERKISPILELALQEDHFLSTNQCWERKLLPVIIPIVAVERELSSLGPAETAGTSVTLGYPAVGQSSGWSGIEHAYWPLKIEDAQLPTYIVPIRPEWAKHLFDEELAQGDLFGADRELAFNREGVYYRSSRPGQLEAPGRILWYVSQGPKQVRACSRLVEIRTGQPKDLYRLYKRLGVWTWRQIYKCAKENLDTKIMALRFDDTVLFKSPVAWNEIRAILRASGCPSTLVSAHRIPPDVFARLYKLGTNSG